MDNLDVKNTTPEIKKKKITECTEQQIQYCRRKEQ